jgi:hypothetical protein
MFSRREAMESFDRRIYLKGESYLSVANNTFSDDENEY